MMFVYLESVYAIHKIVSELHLQRGSGVLQVYKVVEEVCHPHVGVVARLLGPHQVCNHLRRHPRVQVHVLDLAVKTEIDRYPDAVSPAIVPLFVPVPEHDEVF